MRERLCQELQIIGAAVSAARAENGTPDWSAIETGWSFLVECLRSSAFSAEEKMKLDDVDRILKWEFVGVDRGEFDWTSVAWSEIGEVVSSALEVFCRAEKYA